MRFCIFDIEADGLLDTISRVHCLSYQILEQGIVVESGSLVDYEEITEFISTQVNLVGHNIIRYDIPALEKVLGIVIQDKILFDTLGLSWYLYLQRKKHGLESWGDFYGVPKPIIEDWENQSIGDYIHRCEMDVEINKRLFLDQWKYLNELYDDPQALINYITFKIECLKDQEEEGIILDVDHCLAVKKTLENLINEKLALLKEKIPRVVEKEIPNKIYKKDGTLSVQGVKWFNLLEDRNLPDNTQIIYTYGNPGSSKQLKNWLFMLGWKPETFEISKATGDKVPQVSLKFGQGICKSVKKLYDKEPALEALEGLYVAKHRLGIIKSFLDSRDENDKVYATAHGFTNTMRLTHSKPIVNLPGVFKPYGEDIRKALSIPNEQEYIMCGSDISGLEDNTKQHYIFFFDPDYVNDMRTPDFCPHLDIALLGNMVTEDESNLYKWKDGKPVEKPEIYSDLPEEELRMKIKVVKEVRGKAKVVNFSGTYGAGPAKIAKTARKPFNWGKRVHTIYWQRNWAVKKIAKSVKIKTVNNQKWLFNPVSGFWMFLKADKDKFSTLNQSTGAFVFDVWLKQIRIKLKPLGIKVIMQYHDELLLVCKKEQREVVQKILEDSIEETNNIIKLNVPIEISIEFGTNYANVH